MNIKPENRARINAMYYRDELTLEDIAEKLDFSVAFLKRYIDSVDRRIERGEITRQSIINGAEHFSVTRYSPGKKEEGTPQPKDSAPEARVPLDVFGSGITERVVQSVIPVPEKAVAPKPKSIVLPEAKDIEGLPLFAYAIDRFNKGLLDIASFSADLLDGTYTIVLREVKS